MWERSVLQKEYLWIKARIHFRFVSALATVSLNLTELDWEYTEH
jgi:hypothetical protein